MVFAIIKMRSAIVKFNQAVSESGNGLDRKQEMDFYETSFSQYALLLICCVALLYSSILFARLAW